MKTSTSNTGPATQAMARSCHRWLPPPARGSAADTCQHRL